MSGTCSGHQRMRNKKNEKKKKHKKQKLGRKECRMVYMWPSEFNKYLIFFFLTLSENHQSVGGKQMETSNERRERKRAKKTEGRPQIFGLGADFCLSATELVSIRTTRLPGDAFNGPARTDTDLMRQQRRGDGDGDATRGPAPDNNNTQKKKPH